MQKSSALASRFDVRPIQVTGTTGTSPRELGKVIHALLEHQQRIEHLMLDIDGLTAQLPAPSVVDLVVRLRADHIRLRSLIGQLSTASSTG